MSVLLFSLSHQQTPYNILEQLSLTGEDQAKVLLDIQGSSHVDEVFILSTCNRFEVYAQVDAFHPAIMAIAQVLHERTGVSMDNLIKFTKVCYAQAAISHAYSVTSGLESTVIGEQQILHQWKQSYNLASQTGTIGSVLHALAQSALRVGKRIRTETAIDKSGSSLVSIAIDHALSLNPTIKSVAIVGAGAMGSLSAHYSAQAGIDSITVINRSLANAEHLVERLTTAAPSVQARALQLSSLIPGLAEVELVICCTGALGPVIDDDIYRAIRKISQQDKQLFIDLSMPADVCVSEEEIDVINLGDLKIIAAQHAIDLDAQPAKEIIAEEVSAFLTRQNSQSVLPTVAAMRNKAHQVAESELSRLLRKVPDFTSEQQVEISASFKRMIDKLLHTPTVKIKELATTSVDSESPADVANYTKVVELLFALQPEIKHTVGEPFVLKQE